MHKYARLVGIAILMIVVGVAAAYATRDRAAPAGLASVSDAPALRAEVEGFFNHRTAAEARDAFISANTARSVVEQHTAAHVFGEVLYEKEGLPGFSVCDASFGFGCFHSFISFAIAEHGDDVLQQLDATCVSAYGTEGLGCFHGIGHGALFNRGYTIPDLTAALDECAALSWRGEYGGCQDGVFMEYNFRTMAQTAAEQQRPFTYETRHEPCTSIPSKFRVDCYFNLPSWWFIVGTSDAVRADAAQYCAELSSNELLKACFRGIGYAIPPLESFSADQGIAACDALPASRGQKTWCREGLAWAFYADPALRHEQPRICSEGMTPDESKVCNDEYLFTIK